MKSFFAILLLVTSFSVFSQKVKTEKVFEYEIKGKMQTKKLVSEKTFDENGNKIKVVSYDDEGNINKIKSFKYNEKNLIIEEKTANNKGKTTKLVKYEYKNDKKVKKTVFDGNGNIKSIKEWEYSFY